MFHHFPGEDAIGPNCLVRSTNFVYSDETDPDNKRNPIYTFLQSISQIGYRRNNSGYDQRSMPPLEFKYTEPIVQSTVVDVDPEGLENLPIGLDGSTYRWTDLYGEGIPGILTEQAGSWYYKRNLSPIPQKMIDGEEQVKPRFAPLEVVSLKPNALLSDGAQIMDLASNGEPDVVIMDGSFPGYFKYDGAGGWRPYRPFTTNLNRDLRGPNIRFIDLDGDGQLDLLITEDNVFIWHASQGEDGFGPARHVIQLLDEEKSPRIVDEDKGEFIYLADLSGDGLTDLLRIRNSEVCYWPNLGYGRFGAKITMDRSPLFDNPDQFNQKRIRLADIDGSGTTDIIYLHRDGIRLYFNESGNSWSQPQLLDVFPKIDDLASIVPVDLLGNGTACLVWSSPIPGDAQRPMRFVNLMGGQKPHLLVKTINNLGAETCVDYAPSTKFYLMDKHDGNPWVTRLPFPVQVVEKITIRDTWRGTEFTIRYSYHHGFFDSTEREFRGFGRVEQVDVESYGTFSKGNASSPYITDNKNLYQPPVKTITWFHTGAFLDRDEILNQFQSEYFPYRQQKDGAIIDPDYLFSERIMPEPDLPSDDPQ